MSIRPLDDRIVVRRIDADTVSSGGILIPDSAKEKPTQAEVISVGPGKLLDSGERLEPALQIGDRILFGKYSGSEITLDGEKLLILRESDVLAVIEMEASEEKAA